MTTDRLNQILEFLNKLGLTEYESKAYFFLMIHDRLSADDLCKVTNISPSRIYDVLSSLQKKGLVTDLPEKPKKYQAILPSIGLQSIISEREEDLTKELKEIRKTGDFIKKYIEGLSGIQTSTDKKMFIGLMDGKSALIKFSRATFSATKKELLIFAGDMSWLEEEMNRLSSLSKRGISIKIFGNISRKNKKIVGKATRLGIQIRQKPKDMKIRGFVCDRKLLYISKKHKRSGFEKFAKLGIKTPFLVEDYVALISSFEPLVSALKFYFDCNWNKLQTTFQESGPA
jgi:sugar-specific transcriptional regulator TrmB